MNQRLLVLLSAGGAMILTSDVGAMLQGLVVTPEVSGGGPPPTGGPRVIYHVYAQFDSPTDRVNAWGGGPSYGPATIQNILANGNLGTGFTNIGGAGGQIAPKSAGTFRDWDSYMTVGVRYENEAPAGADYTTQFPATPAFIPSNSSTWAPDSNANAGVWIPREADQGMAGFRVIGNDTDTRVLLMQLVVNAGQFVKGTIGVDWSVDGVPGSGGIVSGLTFNNSPMPGGLALFACAGLLSARRR